MVSSIIILGVIIVVIHLITIKHIIDTSETFKTNCENKITNIVASNGFSYIDFLVSIDDVNKHIIKNVVVVHINVKCTDYLKVKKIIDNTDITVIGYEEYHIITKCKKVD